jgi:hypothetical protein
MHWSGLTSVAHAESSFGWMRNMLNSNRPPSWSSSSNTDHQILCWSTKNCETVSTSYISISSQFNPNISRFTTAKVWRIVLKKKERKKERNTNSGYILCVVTGWQLKPRKEIISQPGHKEGGSIPHTTSSPVRWAEASRTPATPYKGVCRPAGLAFCH